MNANYKNEILSLVKKALVGTSQNKLAVQIGISPATLSCVVNENWDDVSDEMWQKIGKAVDWKMGRQQWYGTNTTVHTRYTEILSDAKEESNVYGVVAKAGSGKTFTAKQFASENENVLLIKCVDYWSRKNFLIDMLNCMGKRVDKNMPTASLMNVIIEELRKMDRPLIIFDEADKLSDSSLRFFITLYNELEDFAGIILAATYHLKFRVENGVNSSRRGFEEIYSRIGRKFVDLGHLTPRDILMMCHANGLTDQKTMKDIMVDSHGDGRRVKRKVHALKKSSAK